MAKRMHVGLLVPNDVDYGLDLANALSEIGVVSTLYLSYQRTLPCLTTTMHDISTFQEVEQRLHDLKLIPQLCSVRLFQYPRARDPRSLLLAWRIKQRMLEDGIDVAHIMMGPGDLWTAVVANLLREIPVVSTMIIPRPNFGENLPSFVLVAINRLLAAGSDLVVVNGESQVELLRHLYKVPDHRIAYVPLGPRTTALRRSDPEASEESGTVLFFGRAHPHKGLEYLVKAQPLITSKIPYAHFVIVAHGEYLQQCRQMISDASKFEIYEGFVSAEALASYFSIASLVALPYVSASTSGVLMTAYVFGKPVVATTVGCLPEYVENGVTGLLVPPFNVDRLAEAIIQLLSNDTLRHGMGQKAKQWVTDLHTEVALQTLKVYEKAIAQKL